MSARPITPSQMVALALAIGFAAPLAAAGFGVLGVWAALKVLL